jgi:c(7)-type cytochrome triheme protein
MDTGRFRSIVLLAAAIIIMVAFVRSVQADPQGTLEKRRKPHEYGNVVIDNNSRKNDISPVVFKHWLHRSKYTCRVCHVDIAFAMKAGGTKITCEDIDAGLYCGTCHDGETAFGKQGKNEKGAPVTNCKKCHSFMDESVVFKNEFYEFRKRMPRERFGNGINWMKAEDEGLIHLTDFIENVSFARKQLKNPEEQTIVSRELGMPSIVFSHEKHSKWSGCELCHPDIFGVKKGGTVYGMQDIFGGRFCGACHDMVAFPNKDCQRCHTSEVF